MYDCLRASISPERFKLIISEQSSSCCNKLYTFYCSACYLGTLYNTSYYYKVII